MNKKKNEIILFGGRWTSYLGNRVFDYANTILLTTITSASPIFLGIYQASETLIQLIFNLIGGAFADKNSQKKMLIITDLISSMVCIVLSFFIETRFTIPCVIIFNCFLAISSAFNSPAYKSIIKSTIVKDRIVKYNAISDAGNQIIEVVGPIIGVVILNIFYSRGALIFNAITFGISAMLELQLVVFDSNDKDKTKRSIIAYIIDGFDYLLKDRKAFLIIVIASFVNFFCAGFNFLVPYTNIMFADRLSNSYELILIIEAIAGISGSIIVAKFADTSLISDKHLLKYLGLGGVSALFIPIVYNVNGKYSLLIPFFCLPFFITIFNIILMSYIQLNVNANFLGRVFSIMSTFSVLFIPMGAMIFSLTVDVNGINGFYVVSIGIIILSVIGIAMLNYFSNLSEANND